MEQERLTWRESADCVIVQMTARSLCSPSLKLLILFGDITLQSLGGWFSSYHSNKAVGSGLPFFLCVLTPSSWGIRRVRGVARALLQFYGYLRGGRPLHDGNVSGSVARSETELAALNVELAVCRILFWYAAVHSGDGRTSSRLIVSSCDPGTPCILGRARVALRRELRRIVDKLEKRSIRGHCGAEMRDCRGFWEEREAFRDARLPSSG